MGFPQKLIVLGYVFGKTETGIKYPIADSKSFRFPAEFLEIFHHFKGYILIMAKALHCLRIALLVHSNVTEAFPSDQRQHVGIILSGRDVIDYKSVTHIFPAR